MGKSGWFCARLLDLAAPGYSLPQSPQGNEGAKEPDGKLNAANRANRVSCVVTEDAQRGHRCGKIFQGERMSPRSRWRSLSIQPTLLRADHRANWAHSDLCGWVGIYIALAIGQVLISQVDIKDPTAFNIVVAIFAMALALVSLTHAEPPQITAASALPYGQLARRAPVAVAGAAVSGLNVGTFYALVPAWMQGRGNDSATIGLVMLAFVFGGLAFQIPAGRLSDRFDRRMVLAGLCLGLVGTSIALVYLPRNLLAVLPTAFLFGGFLSTLYPVSVAYAHDSMRGEQVVAVSGRLILLFGLGSILGPLLGTSFVIGFGVNGVLYLIATVALLLALFATARSLTSTPPPMWSSRRSRWSIRSAMAQDRIAPIVALVER